MRTSEGAINILKMCEVYDPVALHIKGDKKDVFTGGYGTIVHPSGSPVKLGDKFDEEYATYCLWFELLQKSTKVNKFIDQCEIKLNQNQFDALVCFAYHLGMAPFAKGQVMGDALYAHDLHAIARAFMLYTKGTKYFLGISRQSVLKDFVKRRQAEKKLFES